MTAVVSPLSLGPKRRRRRGQSLPASLIPQVFEKKSTCVDRACHRLQHVCTAAGLAELVTSGHRLTPHHREKTTALVRSCRHTICSSSPASRTDRTGRGDLGHRIIPSAAAAPGPPAVRPRPRPVPGSTGCERPPPDQAAVVRQVDDPAARVVSLRLLLVHGHGPHAIERHRHPRADAADLQGVPPTGRSTLGSRVGAPSRAIRLRRFIAPAPHPRRP
jgi:hypothetical protein